VYRTKFQSDWLKKYPFVTRRSIRRLARYSVKRISGLTYVETHLQRVPILFQHISSQIIVYAVQTTNAFYHNSDVIKYDLLVHMNMLYYSYTTLRTFIYCKIISFVAKYMLTCINLSS